MAADTRPYKSKEQDGQGNEVIIRDQQLVEQSTVTTMPSGACFETLDIDGRPVKIPRDNMISIVLECIGIVLNDSSKNLGTNVNKALGLQGNTIGNVTVSDFASVLGGIRYGINAVEDSDFNKVTEPGVYTGWSSYTNTAFGSWSGVLTLLVLPKVNDRFVQIHFASSGGDMWLCVREMGNGSFDDWYKIQIPKVTA